MAALTSVVIEGLKRCRKRLRGAVSDRGQSSQNSADDLVSRGAMRFGLLNVKGETAFQTHGGVDADIDQALGFEIKR